MMDTEMRVHVGTYVRLGTRVRHKIFQTTGTIVAHDDAWNNQMKWDFAGGGAYPWSRADAFERADGSSLDPYDLTKVKGAGMPRAQQPEGPGQGITWPAALAILALLAILMLFGPHHR